MKRLSFGLSVALVITVMFCSYAFAKDSINARTFLKFSEAAGFEKRYNKMIEIFASNFQQGMIAGFRNGIGKEDISPEIKQKIYPVVEESASNLKTNFEMLFRNEVKFKDLVDKVYLPVYRVHFSETEIKQLIDFYNSPVGKKVSALTPAIMQESSARFNQTYGATVQKLGSQLVKDELERLNSKINQLKNKK
jgi:hypothetical protein